MPLLSSATAPPSGGLAKGLGRRSCLDETPKRGKVMETADNGRQGDAIWEMSV